MSGDNSRKSNEARTQQITVTISITEANRSRIDFLRGRISFTEFCRLALNIGINDINDEMSRQARNGVFEMIDRATGHHTRARRLSWLGEFDDEGKPIFEQEGYAGRITTEEPGM